VPAQSKVTAVTYKFVDKGNNYYNCCWWPFSPVNQSLYRNNWWREI